MNSELIKISSVMDDIIGILKEYEDKKNWEGDRCIIGRQLAGIGLKRWKEYFNDSSDFSV